MFSVRGTQNAKNCLNIKVFRYSDYNILSIKYFEESSNREGNDEKQNMFFVCRTNGRVVSVYHYYPVTKSPNRVWHRYSVLMFQTFILNVLIKGPTY